MTPPSSSLTPAFASPNFCSFFRSEQISLCPETARGGRGLASAPVQAADRRMTRPRPPRPTAGCVTVRLTAAAPAARPSVCARPSVPSSAPFSPPSPRSTFNHAPDILHVRPRGSCGARRLRPRPPKHGNSSSFRLLLL